MKLFDLSNSVTKEINEVTWAYRLHLKDIFKNFQAEKINLRHAKIQIAKRIEKFIEQHPIDDDAKAALSELVKLIKTEGKVEKIDDLINNLYDIADEYSILVK